MLCHGLKAQSQIKISLFGMALQHPWWLRIHVFYKKVIFYLLSFFRTYSGYAGSKGSLNNKCPILFSVQDGFRSSIRHGNRCDGL